MPALLAIDPGSFTGWAVSEDGVRVSAFGTWKLRLTARWGRGGRLLQLEQHIDQLDAEHDIGRVAFEEPFVGRFSSACMPLAAMVVFAAVPQARSG